jgi:hypothetical protein
MSTFNGDSYVDFRNINLKGGAAGTGLIRWNPAQFQNSGTNWTSNPFGSTDYGLYINSSNQLVYSALGSLTVLGTPGGGGSIPSLNAIFSGSQTLQEAGVATFTIDNNTGNNNVVTLTNSGGGSGVVLQITNAGTGKDIAGTSGTWNIDNTGVMTAKSMTFAGSGGATALELTLGNIVVDAGGLSLTKSANNATLSVTNNSNTSASQVAFAGSGTYTGSTTASFFTITASGLTTGTAVYIPTVALTTGKALQLNYAGTTSHTSGIQMQILSSATAMTSTGRLFQVSHTGVSSASGAGILSEFTSAATDATDVLKVTASSTITGTLLWIAMGSSVTGLGLSIPNVDSITTGFGASIVGSTTALTTTGRMFLVSHTGASTSTGTIAEFITAATDGTVLLKLTSAASVSGVNLSIVGTTGMTTGSLIRATSSTAGAVATNGIYSFLLTGAFTSGSSTVGAFHVAGASTLHGTIMSILGGAQTDGIALNITDPSAGMTSGSLLRIISATTGAVSSNGIVSFQFSGSYTSAASTVGAFHVASSTVAGTASSIRTDSLTTGIGFSVSDGAGTGVTSGSLIRVVSATTSAVATNGIVSIQASANYTSTANVGLLSVIANSTTAGTVTYISGTALTTGTALYLNATGTTSGSILKVVATAATLTTGFYFAANDGGLNVFTVGSNGHLTSNQTTAPTIGTNATGISACAVTAGSTDTCGTITTTGTPASGTVLTLTFNKTYTTAPKFVIVAPANAAAGGVNTMPIITQTATTFVLTWPGSGVYAATPSFTYAVIA